MKALLIDHDDSFTQNLKHWIKPLFQDVTVINHTKLLEIQNLETLEDQYDLFVFSPGPKSPQDYPHSLRMLSALKNETAVFGVCLGMQLMATSLGGTISTYNPPLHGKTSKLQILNAMLYSFQNLSVARYHSIKIELQKNSEFEILATSQDDRNPMWVQHKNKNWMAVQFHPESFLTEKENLHLDYLKSWLR